MKDTLPCLPLTSAINNLRKHMEAEPYVSPATRTATLQALQALEDTLVDEVQFHVEDLLWRKETLYLDYIKALMPQQRRDAIFDFSPTYVGNEQSTISRSSKARSRVTEAWHIRAEHSRPMS